MIIGEAISARLASTTPVVAMVGKRVFPEVATDAKYPLVVYGLEPVGETCIGESSKLGQYDLTVTCEARTYQAAQDLAAAVKSALDKRDGAFAMWGEVKVKDCLFEDADDGHDTDESNPERVFYYVEQTYSFWAKKP